MKTIQLTNFMTLFYFLLMSKIRQRSNAERPALDGPKVRKKRNGINNQLQSFVSFVVNNKLYFNLLISVFSVFSVAKKNMKTNPKRTQTNPIYQRSIFDLSPKMRIPSIFTTTFLCKTNPIYRPNYLEF
jgi:hypothetical protein